MFDQETKNTADAMDSLCRETFDACPILYQNREKPCTKTCMCWGWEMGRGLYPRMKELSESLEALNILFYPKYGVKIVMDQAKTKFGLLRVYFHVEVDEPIFVRVARWPFEKALDWMSRSIDYRPRSDGRGRLVPTKHLFLRAIQETVRKAVVRISCMHTPTMAQSVLSSALEQAALRLISQAETDCHGICEMCGSLIGTDWSPRIETKGWISFVCKRCDAKDRIKNTIAIMKARISDFGKRDSDNAMADAIHKAETEMDAVVAAVGVDDYYASTDELVDAAKRVELAYDRLLDAAKSASTK